jgi:hypothetical protein
MDELQASRAVDFDWTMHLNSVWRDSSFHSPALHQALRLEILSELEKTAQRLEDPLGKVIVGSAGAGKTHLLSALRQEIRDREAWFVLVDMTDISNFWETVLLGYVESLQQQVAGNRPQYQAILAYLLTEELKIKDLDPVQKLAKFDRSKLTETIQKIIKVLGAKYRREIFAYQDILRALVLLNSQEFDLSNIGYSWLQGMDLEEADRRAFGFKENQKSALDIVKSLSWLMSLWGPTLLAFDQLDPIVAQHHLASGSGTALDMNDEQRVSLSIIEGIGGGLMASVRSITHKTLNVVVCLEATWEILRNKSLQAVTDSFKEPQLLTRINQREIAQEIVTLRLRDAFQKVNFTPPYPSWPFQPESFESAASLFPRQILKICEEHRQECLREGRVTELSEFGSLPKHTDLQPPDGLAWLDQVYEDLRHEAPLQQLLAEDSEDETLGKLLQSACRCRIKESPFGEEVDAVVDAEFPGGKSYRSLHARLRLIYRKEGDREKHYCFRALQRSNAIAYQNRLKAAMTAAGIDRSLEFRHLIIVRSTPIPGGSATQSLTNKFRDAGGLSVSPSEQDLRSLWALAKMEEKRDPGFEDWLKARRPVCKLELMQVAKLGKDEKASDNGAEPKKDASEQEPALHHGLPLGKQLIGDQPQEALYVSLAMLVKHTVVLAGSGSGKTVLVRRLTEEAALMGIPSIVIDTANDLARLGDPWPQRPAFWNREDEAKAKTYRDGIEVVVWTPGREKGNPLNLEPLPDLAAVADNTDELEQAVDMARESLQPIVAAGASSGAQKKQGVLTAALKYFAKHQGGRLRNFINLLSDLPPEAGGGISNSVKLAQEIADLLRAEVQKNVLLRQSGTALDPAVLFGDGTANRPRISVINFIGLPSLESQQQFLNQLAMTLFTWIKKYPAPPERPLRGLLIIDEAKDLVPSGKSVPCKASILRLAAQARKYGLGLIFATQTPKSIDHNIIANCSTHYYGKASSPAAIDAIREQLKSRGGSGHDIATLKTGCFYVYTEGLQAPVKVSIPLCLSYHPTSPLDETEVLKRAVRSHGLLFALDKYQRFG